jgi:hypothetical protein
MLSILPSILLCARIFFATFSTCGCFLSSACLRTWRLCGGACQCRSDDCSGGYHPSPTSPSLWYVHHRFHLTRGFPRRSLHCFIFLHTNSRSCKHAATNSAPKCGPFERCSGPKVAAGSVGGGPDQNATRWVGGPHAKIAPARCPDASLKCPLPTFSHSTVSLARSIAVEAAGWSGTVFPSTGASLLPTHCLGVARAVVPATAHSSLNRPVFLFFFRHIVWRPLQEPISWKPQTVICCWSSE